MDEFYDINSISFIDNVSLYANVSLDILDFMHGRHGDIGLQRGSISTVVLMTLLYGVLFVTGVVGNVCTCTVIFRSIYMHTATNYYLFSLAVSDILLLIMGVPQEIYQLWVPSPYMFGEVFCVLRGFTAETSTNASILTITAFTIERYVAICHPLKAHTMSKLSRAVKTMVLIWIVAALCAIPLAMQFGVIYQRLPSGEVLHDVSFCAVKHMQSHAFTVSTVFFFVAPMVVISVLYVRIGLKLRKATDLCESKLESAVKSRNRNSSRKTIVKMLVAVVVSFFLCWSPFHAQRLMAMYMTDPTPVVTVLYVALNNISGFSYYMSATINPILYQVMSHKFQQAFKDTFGPFSKCLRGEQIDEERTVTEHFRATSSRLDRSSFAINRTTPL